MGYIEDLRQEVGHRPLILVGVAVAVFNELGQVLLHKKPSGIWSLPGGLMELGESTEETGRREVLEETGIHIGSLSFVSILSGQDQYVKLANGDEFYAVTIIYSTNDIVGGELLADGVETVEVSFYQLDHLPEPFNSRIRQLILDKFSDSV